jgi:hypothetical protein
MLPDREAETIADWLRAHPGIEVICRDRGGAYARAAREAAPTAVQVADRFHLWQDLAEAAEKTVLACLAALIPPSPGSQDPQPAAAPAGVRWRAGRRRASRAGRVPRRPWPGTSAGRPAPGTLRRGPGAARPGLLRPGNRPPPGAARNTAWKFATAAGIDELLVKATSRPSILDPFKPYLNQRWNDGITSAAALHAEIRARGWEGGILTVECYLRQFRTADGRDRRARAQPQLTAPAAPAPPKPRQVTRWIMTHPDHLASDDAADLARAGSRRRSRAQLRRHDDPPPGPARTR